MADTNLETADMVSVKLPKSLWGNLLADANIARISLDREGNEASARKNMRVSAEICRQLREQVPDGSFDKFGGEFVEDVELPWQMLRKKRQAEKH